jgi:aspartate/methionine/tyrosine aminotransferase
LLDIRYLALLGAGEVALVRDFVCLSFAVALAGGHVVAPLTRRANAVLPDLGGIPPTVVRRAKTIGLNHPINPTAAVSTPEFCRPPIGSSQGLPCQADV